MAKERIGILGGTFDPIHQGHIHMALAAADALNLSQVLVTPAGQPPHKRTLAPAEDRFRMVCAACVQDERLVPCREELDREGVSYTADTVSGLTEKYPKAELFYIIGADKLANLPHWHGIETLLSLCRIVVCPRSGQPVPQQEIDAVTALGGKVIVLEAVIPDASSTDVRAALARGVLPQDVWVPVYEYCGARGLYGMTQRIHQAEDWLPRLHAALSPQRFSHTLAVAHTARQLARIHGADTYQAEAAGLLHDCAKCLPLKEMQRICAENGLTRDASLTASGALLHASVGAFLAASEYGMTHAEVLRAIHCHTTGKVGMTRLDMAVYLADKIEPTRSPYPTLETVRELAAQSLERAMLASLEGTTKHVKKGGKPLHPQSLQTLEWLRGVLAVKC